MIILQKIQRQTKLFTTISISKYKVFWQAKMAYQNNLYFGTEAVLFITPKHMHIGAV